MMSRSLQFLIVVLALGFLPSIARADYLDEPTPDRILSFQTRGLADHEQKAKCEELFAMLPDAVRPTEPILKGTTLHLYDMRTGEETGTLDAQVDGAFVACVLSANFDSTAEELTIDRVNFFILDEGIIAVRNTMHGRVIDVPGQPLMLPGWADGPVIWATGTFKKVRMGEDGDLYASRQNNRFLGEWEGGFKASYNCSFILKLYYGR